MIDYIVGIDFGHGETAAWVIPTNKGENPAKINTEDGCALKLKSSNLVNECVLDSEVYFTPPNTYSLVKTPFSDICNQMKMRVSALKHDENGNKMNAFKAYIKCIIERLFELNGGIMKIENGKPNFLLYMASPTQWTYDEKKEYLNLFNEAISSLNLRFESIIDESDAAFFSRMSKTDITQTSLVIDYGSSTIDYTLVKNGKKISDSKWSNPNLGASCIENAMLTYGKGQDYQAFDAALKATIAYLQEHKLGHIHAMSYLKKACQVAKHNAYKSQDGRFFDIDYAIIKEVANDKKCNIRFQWDGDINEVTKTYQEGVKNDLLSLRQKIREANSQKDPDNIILSGGASIMPWFQCAVKEIFPNYDPIMDQEPSFVVAQGVAMYAKAQMNAVNQLTTEIEKKHFDHIYKEADAEANHQAMCQLSGTVVQDITNSAPITGISIRKKFCDFIASLNEQNVAFSQMVQNNFNNALSSELQKIVADAVQHAFGVKADVSDIKANIPINVLSWNAKNFVPGGAFYDGFTNFIESSSSRFSFTWDKLRDSSEAADIARGVQSIVKDIDFASVTNYPEDFLQKYGEQLKQIALQAAFRLLIDKQLFRTTFTA